MWIIFRESWMMGGREIPLSTLIYTVRDLVYLVENASLPITLKPREYEVFTVVPVKKMPNGIAFAPIGLTKMFNSGGAIKEVKYEMEMPGTVCMKVRGCGPFGAYSSVRPKRVQVGSMEVEFEYDEATGFVKLVLQVPEEEMYLWNIVIEL
ncbi:hypothetical protein OROMI_022755 [Orobanche minor]